MTREEAINALKMMNLKGAHPFLHWEEMMEVRDMAISALRQQDVPDADVGKNEPPVDAVPVVRCRECKNYVIVDEFEGGKRFMCLVNHFSYLDNDGDNQFCSYGERKEGADNA